MDDLSTSNSQKNNLYIWNNYWMIYKNSFTNLNLLITCLLIVSNKSNVVESKNYHFQHRSYFQGLKHMILFLVFVEGIVVKFLCVKQV